MKPALLFAIVLLSLIGCDKQSETVQLNSSNVSISVVGKWNLVRDAMVNPPPYYINSLGLIPNSGVYTGQTGDYYDFKSNGILVIHGNLQTDSTTYSYVDKKLLINGDVFKNLKILMLTLSNFSFECRDTSSNGGTYYHKVDLSR